jgi:hypothetical protein
MKILCTFVLSVALLVTTGCRTSPPHANHAQGNSLPESVQEAVEAQNWFEDYYIPPPAPAEPPYVATAPPGPLPPPGPPPSFEQKYDSSFLAPGMEEVLTSAYGTLGKSLTPDEAAKLQGWSFSAGKCSSSGPRILSARQSGGTQSGHLCIASLLLVSLFLENSTRPLIVFRDQLVGWGIDPRGFTGEYKPELNSKGLTRDEWYAVVGARSGSYTAYVLSVRFLVAFNMERVLLPSSPALEVYRAAIALLKKSGLEWDTDTLGKVLQSALQHASADDWGFESQGDGRQVVIDLASLKGT